MKKILAALLLVACNHVPAPAPATPEARFATPEYTPVTVVDSVYQLKAPDWTGTGWKIDATHMMTAGHVCDGADELTAVSRWNAEYPVKIIKFSREPDLCLIDAEGVPGPGLDKMVRIPAYGDEVWYLGAPHGVWGDGTAPFGKGFYIGGERMMIAGYPGASGSPVFTRDGVFGILVRGFRGTHLIEFETAAEIAAFLAAK